MYRHVFEGRHLVLEAHVQCMSTTVQLLKMGNVCGKRIQNKNTWKDIFYAIYLTFLLLINTVVDVALS